MALIFAVCQKQSILSNGVYIIDKFAGLIVTYKKTILVCFAIMSLICAVLFKFVGVNYNLVDYLPKTAPSTMAISIMGKEFTQAMPSANVMVKNVSIVEALEYKRLLADVPGVSDVAWLDDVVDLKMPLDMHDAGLVETYYKNGAALYMLAIDDGKEKSACTEIRALIGAGGALSGESVDRDFAQNASVAEVLNALVIVLPIFILILMVSTESWLEPILYLSSIGVAVLINMGTNIIFGRVSFLTNSVGPLLQLAVSMDYAIFLLHNFTDNRKKYNSLGEAMKQAIKASITTISASALTTLFGFFALVFMEFTIGADLGLILAKGIIVSFVSVVVFLPALTLSVYKAIDRTRHRSLLPGFQNVYKWLSKTAVPVVIIVIIIIVPSFLGQRKTAFTYGAGSAGIGTYLEQDKNEIEEIFGESNITALLVPVGNMVKERDLCIELENLDYIDAVVSYVQTVGIDIPPEFLGSEITDKFYSENYSRIIIYAGTSNEGDIAFSVIEQINAVTGKYYDEFYLAGHSASLYNIKKIVAEDNVRVNLIAIAAILLVIMISLRALVLPFILLITIETGIWINLSIPYFTASSINFIGYLVLSTVQLGATVDYAILLTDNYRNNRKHMGKKDALQKSFSDSFKPILVSGFTLSSTGFTLYLTSSNSTICDIGFLLGRGTLLSMLMVLCFLPPMLGIFDKLISKTTYKAEFYTLYGGKKDDAISESAAAKGIATAYSILPDSGIADEHNAAGAGAGGDGYAGAGDDGDSDGVSGGGGNNGGSVSGGINGDSDCSGGSEISGGE